MKDPHEAARRWFGRPLDKLSAAQAAVLAAAHGRSVISRDVLQDSVEKLTFGQRLADRMAALGGSWGFILGFCGFLAAWAVLNLLVLPHPFDAYPFIFLNLLLSMLAAIQAPLIMMSQNRQAARDRLDATHDYEVNLKAEIEIMALHEKLDALRHEQIEALLQAQQRQIEMLTRLVGTLAQSESTKPS
ncbi:DUF1003 domain-containing protein [Siccirubricoccus sp. KC 17139]|uniref:DUF1003 domain-containing protein n=1 Tax=Siccirubricoccus soli TaxID=2899147 RepID=A0ABT1D9Z8_9PROT|nr:DUF1003 domain-containing protein [Siccirubricoccus soli]MCO6418768.1 DUF1003 domain-containing protein [Siccirubricoccus soli]MCP2684903.1 DUF1003 domain-containing protein [Siccirubricoccus soli]